MLSAPEIAFQRATERQRTIADRLMSRGWIDPWMYGQSLHLALPDAWHKRNRGVVFRDWKRRGIRITPTGRILRA